MSMTRTSWLNVLAMFYGGAVGDALGFPFEPSHGPPVSEYRGRFEYKPSNIKRSGIKYGVIGQISDDTEMTLALLRSIVDNKGKYSRKKAILAYKDVVNTQSPGIGKNIKSLFSGNKTVENFEKRYKSRFDPKIGKLNPEKAQSNGSLMRCGALALLPGKSYKNVITDTDLTNPNKVNREVGVIYVKILRKLLFDKKERIDPLDTAKTPTIVSVIDQARNKEKRDVTKIGKGWVAHTFYCAVYCLLHFNTYNEAIDWVIKLGGDTDTNAAVAGSVMGAKLGYNLLVDPDFEAKLHLVIEANPKLGDLKRPKRYYPKEFRDLTWKLGEYIRNIELENLNYKHSMDYYTKGYSPCWYSISEDETKFTLSTIIENSLIEVIGEIDTTDNYRVNAVKETFLDAKRVLIDIERELYLENDYLWDTIYFAYRFLTRFIQALTELAISEMNPYVSFSDPRNQTLKKLYGKRFLLLNI